MLNIGCHLSASKGYTHMAKEAISIGGNTFQFFTRNPRGGKAKEVDPKDVESFLNISKENGFAKILAHAPYTINVCSADEGIRKFGKDTMKDDLEKLEFVPGNMYNFHLYNFHKHICLNYLSIVCGLHMRNLHNLHNNTIHLLSLLLQ